MLPSILSALSVLGCAIGASAVPAAVKNVTSRGTFSVPAVRNLNYSVPPTDALLHLYAKHSLTPDENVSAEFRSALGKRQNSAAVHRRQGELLVALTIGGQKQNLAFDTSTDDLYDAPENDK
jgi:hypothetical protein